MLHVPVRDRLLILCVALLGALAWPVAQACTRLVYHGADGHVLTARSMDWKSDVAPICGFSRVAWRARERLAPTRCAGPPATAA